MSDWKKNGRLHHKQSVILLLNLTRGATKLKSSKKLICKKRLSGIYNKKFCCLSKQCGEYWFNDRFTLHSVCTEDNHDKTSVSRERFSILPIYTTGFCNRFLTTSIMVSVDQDSLADVQKTGSAQLRGNLLKFSMAAECFK